MYRFSYAEVLEEMPQTARERERQALEHSIDLLKTASEKGPNSREAVDALHFLRRLWAFFIEDLSKPENDLPTQLRADLISVGLWLLKEADQVRLGQSTNFKGLIEVSQLISDGLQ
jgi:flagellar biosynthesis activator protein FlaF